MPSFEDLARRAQGLTAIMPPMPLAVQWASDRVHELLGKRRVAIYKRNLELSLPAPVTAGTVTIARGERSVQGSSAAQTTWLALGDTTFPEGWRIRIRSAWYRVAGRVQSGAGVITINLESAYAEADAAATSYTLCAHYHALPLNVYQVDEGSFFLSRLGQPLTFMSETILGMTYPHRWSYTFGSASLPQALCEVEPAASGARQLEIVPYPNQSELLTYSAYVDPPPFTYASQLPLGLDIHHMLPGVMADFYGWRLEQQPPLDAQQMMLMLNEKARCLTRFEAAKEQALQHLEAGRTTAFVLMHPSGRGWSPGGIHDAYQEIWSRP